VLEPVFECALWKTRATKLHERGRRNREEGLQSRLAMRGVQHK
jgi:hypothetical protein